MYRVYYNYLLLRGSSMQNIRDLIDMHQPDGFQVNIILKNNLKLNKYSTGKNCK